MDSVLCGRFRLLLLGIFADNSDKLRVFGACCLALLLLILAEPEDFLEAVGSWQVTAWYSEAFRRGSWCVWIMICWDAYHGSG